MNTADTIREIFYRLPEVFVPEKAGNLKAKVQIELSGEGASSWVINIADGQIVAEEGNVSNPDMTLQMEGQDYIALTKGNADPVALFAQGKIKMQGDMGLAMKFPQMFSRPK